MMSYPRGSVGRRGGCAVATEPKTTGYTYADLLGFPDDSNRREIIDGELFVTPPPSVVHQRAVVELVVRLAAYRDEHGGEVLVGPVGLYFTDRDFVEPDVVFVLPEHLERVERWRIVAPPDLVVEVSSPSTRLLEVKRKRDLYERGGVPEYWYVDLEADRIEVYRLHEGQYGLPALVGRGDALESIALAGFAVDVRDVLGPPEN
jgi:Uma2 family endonuclease